MTLEKVATLLVLGLTMAALVREWMPAGLVGILAPLSLVLVDVLPAAELRHALAHESVVAVAAMFVVSAGVSRTGALGFVGDLLSRLARRGRRRIVGTMMLVVAVLSAFINNTTVVLVFIPVVLSLCERIDQPPSRYLIPLSFASIFGGMMTLVGTSTNVVVAVQGRAMVKTQFEGEMVFDPGMWDFTPMGLIFMVAGVAYLMFGGLRLLPDRVALSLSLSRGKLTEYVTEAEIPASSTLIGRSLGDITQRRPGLRVLQLIRNDVIEVPEPEQKLQAGDILLVKGNPSQLLDLRSVGSELLPDLQEKDMRARQAGITLAEVIVPPRSRWIGQRVQKVSFRARYGVSVIAVQRHGHHIREKVGKLRLEPADILLVQGRPEDLRHLRSSDNFILMEGVDRHVILHRRAPLALGMLVVFVLLVTISPLDLATAAIVAATGMVVTRCLTLQEAFHSVDWNVLFLLAGFLALGSALESAGLQQEVADGLWGLLGDGPPWLLVGGLYLVCAFLTDILTNVAVAALMVPIVVEAAARHQHNPAILVMTVAFAASGAFLTPMGYQTNLLVYAPGGYRFQDFLRVGLPLRLIFLVLAAIFIPWLYG